MTSYENSFGVKAAKLWNILPKAVNMTDELESFKVTLGSFLATFPDKPPVTGYTTTNTNYSLLDLSKGRGERTLDAAALF